MSNLIKPLWLKEINNKPRTNINIFEKEFDVHMDSDCGNFKFTIAFFRDGPLLPVMTGAAASILGMMKYLSRNGVKVVLIKCLNDFDDFSFYKKLPFKTYFLDEETFYCNRYNILSNFLKKERIDIVQFDSAEAINFQSKYIPSDIIKVFEVHNVESDLLKQYNVTLKEYEYIKNHEIRALKNADFLLFRSKENFNKYPSVNSGNFSSKIKFYKGSVDSEIIEFNERRFIEGENILFLGHLNYLPNIKALDNIAKYIAPNINKTIMVVGDLSRKVLMKYKKIKNISFYGRVDDLEKVFSKAFVGIAPLDVGSGTRIKVLDYLMAGLPFVGSSLSVKGLEENIYKYSIIEDDYLKYPNIINNIPQYFTVQKINNARKFIIKNRSWDSNISDLIKVYKSMF